RQQARGEDVKLLGPEPPREVAAPGRCGDRAGEREVRRGELERQLGVVDDDRDVIGDPGEALREVLAGLLELLEDPAGVAGVALVEARPERRRRAFDPGHEVGSLERRTTND